MEQFFLYGPAAPFIRAGLSVIAVGAIHLGLPRTVEGSASARFFVVALVLVIAVWVLVLAPETGYVRDLTE